MLTSSPIAPRATSASPQTFQYTPSRSPIQSPKAHVSAPLSRRLSKPSPRVPSSSTTSTSTTTIKSPSQPRPRHYVAVDAATQYSPMEPFDPTVLLQGAQRLGSQAANTTTAILADPRPSSTVPEPPPEPSVTPESHKLNKQGAAPFSPNKRRNPHDHTHAQSSNPVVVPSQPISPKRSKPNATPPKVLPLQYELCAVEDIVVLIANMVGELIETNDKLAIKSGNLTRFHSRTAPGISVLDYLQRLAKHATLTPPLLLSMVFYIDRLCAMYPDFTINSLTVHRFLITAATVAGKGLSDSFWNNSFYARVGGIKVAELKLLELDFLCRVDWKIVPIPEVLVYNYRCLVERCAGYTLPDEPEISMQDDDSDEIGDDEFDA